MYHFQASIHARPAGSLGQISRTILNQPMETLVLTPAQQAAPMPVTFEQAYERLSRLPRLFVEPDGAFVWVGEHEAGPWQVDGCLYDGPQQLVYVEIAGCCPPAAFDQLLAALGWPDTALIFQLPHHSVFLDELVFRSCVGQA